MTPTAPRARILAAIHDAAQHGRPMPSMRDLMRLCGLSSTSVARNHLRQLAEAGAIVRVPGVARGYALPVDAGDAALLRWCASELGAPSAALVAALAARGLR